MKCKKPKPLKSKALIGRIMDNENQLKFKELAALPDDAELRHWLTKDKKYAKSK